MTLVELKYVVALAHEKHFRKAADACYVTQPTLSVAIKKLESRLNVVIFERHHHEVRVTVLGEKIVAQAQRILEESDKLTTMADEMGAQLDSPFKLGAIHTVGPYLFPKLITKLRKLAPEMPLVIQEDLTANLNIKLQSGELDAIFVALPFTETGILTKVIYQEEFGVLLPKNHKLSEKSAISANDLRRETVLLLGEGHCFREQVIQACPSCYGNDPIQQSIQGTSLETLRHMVASGLGITILPETATNVTAYSHILTVKPFKGKAPSRQIALAWRRSFPRIKAIDTIIKACSVF